MPPLSHRANRSKFCAGTGRRVKGASLPLRKNARMDLMSLPRRQFLRLAAGASVLPVGRAFAQSYPARPVRIVVGFAAGTGLDLYGRLIGQWLSERLGQSFVV